SYISILIKRALKNLPRQHQVPHSLIQENKLYHNKASTRKQFKSVCSNTLILYEIILIKITAKCSTI
ncbi:MAG: hypothetical protein ACE5RC_08780, partial [Nitrosopumilus sp.]